MKTEVCPHRNLSSPRHLSSGSASKIFSSISIRDSVKPLYSSSVFITGAKVCVTTLTASVVAEVDPNL